MSNSGKKVYYFPKKVYWFFQVFMIPCIAVKLIGLLQKNKSNKVPQKDEVDDIISMLSKVRLRVNSFLELDGTTMK